MTRADIHNLVAALEAFVEAKDMALTMANTMQADVMANLALEQRRIELEEKIWVMAVPERGILEVPKWT